VTYASLSPASGFNEEDFFEHIDKVIHFVMYLGMSFLVGAVFKQRPWLIAFMGSITYGYLMEILQSQLNNGRSFDYFDILANIFGAFAGTMLIYKLNKKR